MIVNTNYRNQNVRLQFKTERKVSDNAEKENQEKLNKGTKCAIGLGLVALAVTGTYLITKGKTKFSNKPVPANQTDLKGKKTKTKRKRKPIAKPDSKPVVDTTRVINAVDEKAKIEEMRAYIFKKRFPNEIYSEKTPCKNYSDIIYKNYLDVRYAPEDYYKVPIELDLHEVFFFSRQCGNGIHLEDQNGWFYKIATKNMKVGVNRPEVVERISLNVSPEEGLIKSLDSFIKRTRVNVEYKLPMETLDWFKRHDPVTMYFREEIPQDVKDEIIKIVFPYIRKTKSEVMIGKKLAEGIYQVAEPTEKDVLRLIQRAEKLGDDKLIKCLKATGGFDNNSAHLYHLNSKGEVVVRTTPGIIKSVEMLLDDLEKIRGLISK